MSLELPQGFTGFLSGQPETVVVLILLVVSLALVFAGREIIKALAFLITGAVGAVVGSSLATAYLGALGTIGQILGAVAGFLVGGLFGIMLVVLGIGIALGYVGYSIASGLFSNEIISLVTGLVLFAIGIVLADRILEVATAFLGGLLLYNLMTSLGIGVEIAAVFGFLVGILGVWTQMKGPMSHVRRTSTVTTVVQS